MCMHPDCVNTVVMLHYCGNIHVSKLVSECNSLDMMIYCEATLVCT